MVKVCNKCKIEKDESMYYKQEGRLMYICKECAKAKIKAYREKDPEAHKKRKHESYIRNKESILKKQVIYKEKNKERIAKYFNEYWHKNKDRKLEYLREYNLKRSSYDLAYKITKRLRYRIWAAVSGLTKSESTCRLIGCDIDTLIKHLEERFTNGMSWDNYGEWHMDHIRPCASFDLSDPAQQKLCFNYKNLQPMWGKDNQSKNDKWDASYNESWLKMIGEVC